MNRRHRPPTTRHRYSLLQTPQRIHWRVRIPSGSPWGLVSFSRSCSKLKRRKRWRSFLRFQIAHSSGQISTGAISTESSFLRRRTLISRPLSHEHSAGQTPRQFRTSSCVKSEKETNKRTYRLACSYSTSRLSMSLFSSRVLRSARVRDIDLPFSSRRRSG
jgi:hypothetical protein